MGVSRLLDISSRSLGVYQRALEVTSHNVANANNPNFSRQRVLFTSERTEIQGGGEWGTGVKIQDVLRVRDRLTDVQIRSYNQKFADTDTRAGILGQVETLFNEPSENGLSSIMNSFFNSWDELAVSPNADHLKGKVIQEAQRFASKIQSIYEGMNQTKADIIIAAEEKVGNLNTYLHDIQTINQKILESNIAGNPANDLLDQRDAVIDELSKLTNIDTFYGDNGTVSVSIGGVFAADAYIVNDFKLNLNNDQLSISTKDENAVLNLSGGEINATLDIFNNRINEYLGKLDSIANTVMNTVNDAHRTGFTSHEPPVTGVEFFKSYTNGKLEINDQILGDPKFVAASGNGESGNGDIALKIAGLKNSKLIEGKSISEFYGAMISSLGSEVKVNTQNAQTNQLVLKQLDNLKASVSGVSIDEEMTNVIKFQRSYDASAKLIKIADEVLQTLLNMV